MKRFKIMKLKIGSLELENPVIMAPLSGYCDSPYRRLVRSFGCALTYSGLISSHALVCGNSKTLELLRHDPREKPIALQIFGNDPMLMAEGASILESAGADIIDINLGCGAPKVFKTGSGMALCEDLELLEKILKAVISAVSIPVMIKTRIGFNPTKITILEVAGIAERIGISAIAIHSRYHCQKFSGKAEHSWAKKIKKITCLPVIGSGDINIPGDVIDAISRYGYDGIMIGRGALGNPWLFSRSISLLGTGILPQPPTVEEKIDVALKHLNLIEEHYSSSEALHQAKLHIRHYLHGMNQASKLRDILHRAVTTSRIRNLLNNIKANCRAIVK
ncbi:MAG: tRNA dihydrouridine synthase DusB [Candidatus Eremiobacteraeota bacterium]|nr:tRNA dihydrouridine synthase DusB [Candidatus Eremiobacteraeota bacterium]